MRGRGYFSRSVEDYLKAIYTLTRDEPFTSTIKLAEALAVAPASVSNMLQKLDEHQPRLVNYQKHRGVSLTPNGEQAALKVIRRHRLIEQFLYEILGYPWEDIHVDAEELEHVISPYFEDRLAKFLGEPAFDPHGEPIPNRDLNLRVDEDLVVLSNLQPGQAGTVQGVNGQRKELLPYFNRIGLRPGSEVKVLQRNPVDGTLRVSIDQNEQFFSPAIGEAVWIKLQERI